MATWGTLWLTLFIMDLKLSFGLKQKKNKTNYKTHCSYIRYTTAQVLMAHSVDYFQLHSSFRLFWQAVQRMEYVNCSAVQLQMSSSLPIGCCSNFITDVHNKPPVICCVVFIGCFLWNYDKQAVHMVWWEIILTGITAACLQAYCISGYTCQAQWVNVIVINSNFKTK